MKKGIKFLLSLVLVFVTAFTVTGCFEKTLSSDKDLEKAFQALKTADEKTADSHGGTVKLVSTEKDGDEVTTTTANITFKVGKDYIYYEAKTEGKDDTFKVYCKNVALYDTDDDSSDNACYDLVENKKVVDGMGDVALATLFSGIDYYKLITKYDSYSDATADMGEEDKAKVTVVKKFFTYTLSITYKNDDSKIEIVYKKSGVKTIKLVYEMGDSKTESTVTYKKVNVSLPTDEQLAEMD